MDKVVFESDRGSVTRSSAAWISSFRTDSTRSLRMTMVEAGQEFVDSSLRLDVFAFYNAPELYPACCAIRLFVRRGPAHE